MKPIEMIIRKQDVIIEKLQSIQRQLCRLKKNCQSPLKAKLEMSKQLVELQKEHEEEIIVINRDNLRLQLIIDRMEEDSNLTIAEAKELARNATSEVCKKTRKKEDIQ